jgi:type III pantothenate kinase
MLLVIDVGNTNTVLGVFARKAESARTGIRPGARPYGRLAANWRVGSHLRRTVDEYGVIFRNLFSMENLEVSSVHGIVISLKVVRRLIRFLRQVCERYLKISRSSSRRA